MTARLIWLSLLPPIHSCIFLSFWGFGLGGGRWEETGSSICSLTHRSVDGYREKRTQNNILVCLQRTSRPHSSGPVLERWFFKKEPEIGAGNSGTEVPYSEFLGSLNGTKIDFYLLPFRRCSGMKNRKIRKPLIWSSKLHFFFSFNRSNKKN